MTRVSLFRLKGWINAAFLAPFFCFCGMFAQLPDSTQKRLDLAHGMIQLMQMKDFIAATSHFDAQMKALVPPARLQLVWQQIESMSGAYLQDTGYMAKPFPAPTLILKGKFEKQGMDLKFSFRPGTDTISGFWISPSQPQKPYHWPAYVDVEKFTEEEIILPCPNGGLPGTISRPVGIVNGPVVVLVHGSGPNDRDESIGGSKVFRDLAGGLASLGITVVRFDKRTLVYGAGKSDLSMTLKEETVDDAVAILQYCKTLAGINPSKIYLLGHSLGGYAAPRIAAACPFLAGFVMLAASYRPLEDLILAQVIYLYSPNGIDAFEQPEIDKLKQQVKQVKSLKPGSTTPASALPLGIPADYWIDLKSYDHGSLANKFLRRIFVLQGERDYQVTMEDFALWQKVLKNKKNTTFRSYPKLNHLFIAGEGPSLPKEYDSEGHVDPQVITDLVEWLKK